MNDALADPRLRKLCFRAWRRGIREADLILGPFADANLDKLDPAQLDRFEALLEEPDVDLYAWIIGQKAAPAAFDHDVLHLIRDFRFLMHDPAAASRGG